MRKLEFILTFLFFFNSFIFAQANNIKTDEVLSNRAFCLTINQEVLLTANLENRANEKNTIYWASSDPVVASLSDATRTSVKIKGLTLGQCDITLYIDRRPISSCRIIVDDDGIVKILAIGNSFSEDAIEQNLYEIVKAEGIPIVIGNMYIGGCSLEQHLRNANTDAPAYSYRKITDGTKKTNEKVKISEAINDENWDFITLQQASHFSGIPSTYQRDLSPLLEYVEKQNPKKETQYGLHQTWAYANDSGHDGFRNYNNDQMTMYERIIDATTNASDQVGLEIIIPAGTAIQNGRASFIGDNFNRDGYHLDLYLGRYTAACTWAEKLLGLDVLSNPYFPEHLTLSEILVARNAANDAVNNPYCVTKH